MRAKRIPYIRISTYRKQSWNRARRDSRRQSNGGMSRRVNRIEKLKLRLWNSRPWQSGITGSARRRRDVSYAAAREVTTRRTDLVALGVDSDCVVCVLKVVCPLKVQFYVRAPRDYFLRLIVERRPQSLLVSSRQEN